MKHWTSKKPGKSSELRADAKEHAHIAALGTPNERQRSQRYFQRYVPHLPAAGEVVLFDRS